MAKYIFILYDDPRKKPSYTPEQMQKVIEEYGAWAAKLAEEGRLAGGHKLQEDGGKVLRADSARQVTVIDGPYSEAKEVIAGFFLVEAEGYDEAVAIAKSCPHMRYGLKIEVRAADHACEGAASRAGAASAR
jgi:hypothetical protein